MTNVAEASAVASNGVPPVPGEATEPAKAPTNAKPAGKQNNGRVDFANSKYKIHPDVLALGIPFMTSAEYDELRSDVQKAGRIREPIKMARELWTKEEFVVDGNHRINLADELGYEPGTQYKIEWVAYDDAVDVAMSSLRRRNLDEKQKGAIGLKLLKVEQDLAKRRQAANARVQTMLNSANKPETVEVEFTRLKKGGDIAAANSADTIMTASKMAQSKLRGTFEHEGGQYTIVEGNVGARMIAYRLATIPEFKAANGNLTNYVTRKEDWAKGEKVGLYDGILVQFKNGDETITRVLQGPPIIFTPKAMTEDDEAANEVNEKGKGKGKGKAAPKKKERASEKAAKQVGMSARNLEMLAYIEKKDKAAYNRIQNNENIPGTERPETISSSYERLRASEKQEEVKEGEAKAPKNTLRDPEAFNCDDFIKGTPLYESLQGEPEYIEAVRFWYMVYKQLANLKSAISRSNALNKDRIAAKEGYEGKNQFARVMKAAYNIPHPDLWSLEPANPGGFSTKRIAALKAEAKADAKETENKPAPAESAPEAETTDAAPPVPEETGETGDESESDSSEE